MSTWITNLTQKIECWSSKTKFVYWLTSQYYRNVIRNEISLANITDNDNVLCIGGGICPFSAILLHQSTGAKVTVIDNNAACFQKAYQVIDRMGLGGYIRVLCQDGGSAELSLTEYSVVHFALQVCPMEHVFTQIEKRVTPGTKLLIRRPKKPLSRMYGRVYNSMLNYCRHVTHKKSCIGSTLLYIKQRAIA